MSLNKINHPGQNIYISVHQMILWSGHPSLKKGGEIFPQNFVKLTAIGERG
jgi:hypothetical protein